MTNCQTVGDRREFLLATIAAGAGVLAAPSALGAVIERGASSGRRASCILIHLAGGVAQTDTWDPKEFTPFRRGMKARDVLGTAPSIPTAIPGVRFASGLDEIASVMDRGCVVRSLVPDLPRAAMRTAEHTAGAAALATADVRALEVPTHAPCQQVVDGALGTAALRIAGPPVAGPSTDNPAERFAHQLDWALHRACDGPCVQRVEFPFEPFGGFDTHDFGARRMELLKRAIDQPIADLVRGLEARGVLDRTLVIVTSEFGRTVGPARESAQGQRPADPDWLERATVDDESMYGFHAHFADCTSALLFGGGVRRGIAWGRSADEHPMLAVSDPISWSSWVATLRTVLDLELGEFAAAPICRGLLARAEIDA